MVYQDSFATITDPENNSTRYIKLGDSWPNILNMISMILILNFRSLFKSFSPFKKTYDIAGLI